MNINGQTLFRSDKNYMKRDPSSGQTVMLGPNVSQYFGNFYIREFTVTHGLGYVPFFRAFYEPYQDGVLYPIIHDTDYVLSNPINDFVSFLDAAPTLMAEADEMTLKFTLHFPNNSLAAASFPVYWVIYKDFGLVA